MNRVGMKLLWVALLSPSLALAAVGKVSVLQGAATRTSKAGKAAPLALGSDIELGDTLKVGPGGNMKLTLSDESVLMVGADSELRIEEAAFEKLERKGFSAKLLFGKIWAKVTKAAAGSEAKFEVTTERAVAGVRGTIFRVDATKLLKAATQAPKSAPAANKGSVTTVRVSEGKVAVEAQVKKVAAATPPATGTADAGTAGTPKKRVQIAGPKQISKDEWEKKFVELQANQQVTIGEELWTEAPIQIDSNDAFAKFVDENDQG
jgi:hypothetical protein